MDEKEITAESYTLRCENGSWLGQIVITNDGFLGAVTDYGNFSFAWRYFGEDFKKFLLNINEDYFGCKMFTGMSYVVHTKKVENACHRFAEKILPELKKALSDE